ncbi:MAG: NADH-quinone oxidoreductase subunit NuoH [Chloroflexi bacterium]|nr:NADH-quinone oxidoreductase subunit NuoH [Chloroflexota bacterium]
MDWINLILIPAIKSVILVVVLLTGFAYLTWVERKLISRFQQRIGPNRAWKFGLGHPIADALKMIFKEETVPSYTDKVLFILGPALAIAPALLIFAVVPVGPTLNLFGKDIPLVVADVNVGVLWVLAVVGLGTYGIVLGGWASNNKYSLLGALRTSSQMLSYELPMGILLIAILLVYGTLNLNQIVTPVIAIPWYLRVWLLLAFPLYFITMLAETSRKPFDFPETENELVAGFQTEYGSIKFALYYMTEYLHILGASGVAVTLFFGGWRGPFVEQVPILGLFYFTAKVLAMVFLFIWASASVPRPRYDQLLRFCWTFMFPVSLVYMAITAVIVVLL